MNTILAEQAESVLPDVRMHLPLLPASDQQGLASVIDALLPMPEAEVSVPPAKVGRVREVVTSVLVWLGLMSESTAPSTPLDVRQQRVRQARHDLVVWAQHVWESRLRKIEEQIRAALGPGNEQQVAALLPQIVALITPGAADGTEVPHHVATQPKLVIGAALAPFTGRADIAAVSVGDAWDDDDFWAGRACADETAGFGELPVSTRLVSTRRSTSDGAGLASTSLVSTSLVSTSSTSDGTGAPEWRAITRVSEANRRCVRAWFSERYASEPSTRAVSRVSATIDDAEWALLNLKADQPADTDTAMWAELRGLAKAAGIGTAFCLVAVVMTGLFIVQWVSAYDLRSSLAQAEAVGAWLLNGIVCAFGWLAVTALACAWAGFAFVRPDRSTTRATRANRPVASIVTFVISGLVLSLGPFLPDFRLMYSDDAFMLLPWPTSGVTTFWTKAAAIFVCVVASMTGASQTADHLVRLTARHRQPDPSAVASALLAEAEESIGRMERVGVRWDQVAVLRGRVLRLRDVLKSGDLGATELVSTELVSTSSSNELSESDPTGLVSTELVSTGSTSDLSGSGPTNVAAGEVTPHD